MKKINGLLAALLCFGFGSLVAQDHGVRVGFQAAGQFEDGNQKYGTLNSFYAGVYRTDDIVPFLDWYKGVEYLQTGFYSDDNNLRKIHTLSVPVALRAKVGPVFALAGLAANFKVAERYEIGGVDVLDDNTKAKFFDLPVLVGVGVKLLIVSIEARYAYGLIDVNDGVNNAYIQLGAAVDLF